MEVTLRRSYGPTVRAEDLYRFFHAGDDETRALRGVSLSAGRGEVVAVVGPSGSGKSTLLSCIAGLDEPDGGSVSIDGDRMSRRTEATKAALRANSIGVVLQSGNLLEHLTVSQNIKTAQKLASRPGKKAPAEILMDVGLTGRATSYPSMLSGGEAVKAAIAVALANDPTLLLADEPTGELDPVSEAKIIDLFLSLAQRGVTVVVATHSGSVAKKASRVINLQDGRIVDV
jgi:putative ABC transport system ATP-binding protein